MHKKNHGTYFKILLVYVLISFGFYIFSYFTPNNIEKETYGTGRNILQLKNCSPRAVEDFPPDFMTRKQREQGGIIFHIVLSIYLFMALTIICDDYFVSSLDRICEKLNLKRDVAGATFMAAGSSAPELCTSVIGVFITQSDVGISTIIGSAIFNLLCILAICGLFSGLIIHLTWWPMFRDCVVYCFSIIALIIILNDDFIFWYEAFVMLIMYALYIILLYHNDKVHLFFVKYLPFAKISKNPEYNPLIVRTTPNSIGVLESSDEEEIMETGDVDSNHSRIMIDEDMSSLEGESSSIFEIPDSFCQRLYWVAMLPVTVMCFLTIPDCRKPGIWRRLYMMTFIMSVIWISGATYILVWMICTTGDALQIPDTVMGLTFLAVGTSVPDALAGFIVAKDGFGDMAISNSIGSNVFDILICLGLPWFLKTGLIVPGSGIQVTSSGLLYTSVTLLSTVAILVVTVMLNKWTLNKLLGFIFLVLYIVIIGFACLYELNIFGEFSLPSCPRTIF